MKFLAGVLGFVSTVAGWLGLGHQEYLANALDAPAKPAVARPAAPVRPRVEPARFFSQSPLEALSPPVRRIQLLSHRSDSVTIIIVRNGLEL